MIGEDTLRKKLWRILERPNSSKHAKIFNTFLLCMVVASVFLFYAETTPEMQQYGLTSDLCRMAINTYCNQKSNDVESNPGCFVLEPATIATISSGIPYSATPKLPLTPLNFFCTNSSTCFGSANNYGAFLMNATTCKASQLFQEPDKICKLRQCNENTPALDMTLKWVYFEWLFGIVFTTELLLRLYASKNRKSFLRSVGTLIDIVAVAPFYAEVRVVVSSISIS